MTLGCGGRFGKQEEMNEWVVLLLHSVKPLRVLPPSHNTFYFGFMVSIFEASHCYMENVNCCLKQHKCLTLSIRGTQWYFLIHSADLPSTVLWGTSACLVYWMERNSLICVRMSTEPLNKRLPVTTSLTITYRHQLEQPQNCYSTFSCVQHKIKFSHVCNEANTEHKHTCHVPIVGDTIEFLWDYIFIITTSAYGGPSGRAV